MTSFIAIQTLGATATNTGTQTPVDPQNIAEVITTNAALITPQTFAVLLVLLVAVVTIFALALIYRHVKDAATKWSLADALSEEASVGPAIKNKAEELVLDKEGNVQYANEMRASSSRLIALLGAVAIMMLYVGAGLAVLMEFASKGSIPAGTKELTTFFLYGMVLFAPYIVNKFSNIFGWLK